MNTILKSVFSAMGGIIFVIVVCGLYFVSQLSAVYPPMKEYEFPVSALQLQSIIFEVSKMESNLHCNITDTTGSKDNLAYYMNIKIKKDDINYNYTINYKDVNKFWDKKMYSELRLTGAFDSINKVGGYKRGNKELERLIDFFDQTFISKLEMKLHY